MYTYLHLRTLFNILSLFHLSQFLTIYNTGKRARHSSRTAVICEWCAPTATPALAACHFRIACDARIL